MGCNCICIPKLQQCSCWSLGIDMQFHPTFNWACDHLSMCVLKLINVCKRSPWDLYAHDMYQTCMHILLHYNDVIMGAIASQITSLTIVYSTIYSDADQRKHQSSTSLAFVQEIHRRLVNFPHKWPVTLKMFSFDDVIMCYYHCMFITYFHQILE